ncbi:hypothetical protein HBB16_06845 [Pseudonocardia sp. MCCB 268]|nr:hypothetical protein [Pseudonocardia cytotoxica]
MTDDENLTAETTLGLASCSTSCSRTTIRSSTSSLPKKRQAAIINDLAGGY